MKSAINMLTEAKQESRESETRMNWHVSLANVLKWEDKFFSLVFWYVGERQDNLNAKRPDSLSRAGYRYFVDDEDEFGLEDVLQAICYLEVKSPWYLSSNQHPLCAYRMIMH